MPVALAVTVALIAPAPASATTFCVPTFDAACPNNGTNVAQANVETAMSTSGSDGIADTVMIAPGTYTDAATFNASGTDPLTVRGAGAAQTELTSSAAANIYVLDLISGNTRPVDVHDLTVVVPASFPDNGGAAAQVSGDTLENVDVEVRNPGSNALTSWTGVSTFQGGRIYATGTGTVSAAIRVNSLTFALTVADATIEDTDAPITNNGAVMALTVRGTRILDPAQPAVVGSAGDTVVENSTVEMTGPTAIYAFINSAADATVTVDHLTARNDGSGNSAAVASQVGGGMVGDAKLVVRNSILRGYAFPYMRSAPAGPATGDADLSFAYTNHVPGPPAADSGDGTTTLGAGNTTTDPQLAGDMSLPAGSPAVDAADPASTLSADILGALRPRDGNGDGVAVADQGAFEYQPPAQPPDTTPPDTVAGKGPKRKSAKRKATFRFSSEPGATFACRLDDRKPQPCTSPFKVKRLKRGRHLLTVTAADAAGNADPTPAHFRFRTVRKR